MAVAVKNTPDVGTPSLFDRVAVASLVGVVYLLGSLAIVFGALPALWWNGFKVPADSFTGTALLGLAMVVVFGALAFVGLRLLGPHPTPGTKAGIFVGLVGILIVVLLTRWISTWVENRSFLDGWFSPTTGAIICAVVGLGLLLVFLRWFLRPKTEKMLVRFENQGWFTATGYKPLQGQKVRRGTIFGILVLVACGIYTLYTHGSLTAAQNWEVAIPFTGKVTVEKPGDADFGVPDPRGLVLDRYAFRDVNAQVDPKNYVKIAEPGDSDLKKGTIISKPDFEKEAATMTKEEKRPPTGVPPVQAEGSLQYASITLLPNLKFTVPLLLLAISIWLAWRVVNYPVFADFLIATEAELNKVSWSTRPRLIQDTIVVLVTVVLMAIFLFGMDIAWKTILKPIGVLQIPEDKSQQNVKDELRKW
jgi:preprotein translocase SecE subunit